jgi:Transposase DDE domain
MPHRALTALQEILRPRVGLSKSRLETLCLIVVGMVSARTVNLSHLACERPTTALVASTYRRLQRFFQHVRLGSDWSAPLVIGLLGLAGPWHLALDRTQWKLGTRDVNILMLAVVTPRARVPLMWSVLDNHGGTSDSRERIALMQRYLAIFGAASIRLLLADREFVGLAWMNFLHENNIPFAVRMKEKLLVATEDGRSLALGSLLRKCRGVRSFRAALGREDAPGRLWLNFAARRLAGGALIIVASNTPARTALAAYRKRWAIECLFGDTKTRGLNLEDTRLVTPRKLALLLALVALAVAWATRTATRLLGRNTPARKPHGYLAKSWFRIGFDQVRRLLRHDPAAAIQPWLIISPRRGRKARVV